MVQEITLGFFEKGCLFFITTALVVAAVSVFQIAARYDDFVEFAISSDNHNHGEEEEDIEEEQQNRDN